MKIAEINMLLEGSTGKIMLQIAEVARNNDAYVKTYSPVRFIRGKKIEYQSVQHHSYWGTRLEAFFHYYAGTLLGRNGLYSKRGTKQLIKSLEDFSPDIIHIHNIHSYCVNLPILFDYIRKNNVKVIWTLHDCWTFTGHCPHFTLQKCEKWKTCCHHCPQPRIYPKMYLDTSKKMYALKKKLFCGIKDLTLVTPSIWLSELVRQSFLKNYPVKVINNGIDLSIFKPTESDFKRKYDIHNKRILLGVAFDWGYKKGLDVFIELSKRLDENQYQIVLVGTNESIDKQLPSNIISIHRTNNQSELAEIYTAADLFVNPTREDNYPTVNMESIACGTPVITFRTGGAPECLDKKSGVVVDCDDVDSMEREIIRICNNNPFCADDCINRAKEFDMKARFDEYIELYKELMNK